MRAALYRRLIGLIALGIGACGSAPATSPTRPAVSAAAWPEAAELFHKEPRWLGADAAYSVPLGADRLLWLFGDTFIATSAANVRTESVMVRNTVAVQTGTDPVSAAITFHWRETATGPKSFLPEDGERWY
ncbi:MAG TPA: hypothetical protein VFH73_05230, partial [Polyangia bacterium]|nr:hypothetical protein [Polyangia bacterium]